MTGSFHSFDYMNRFTCIGPDCEDTCCSGWKVNLYREDYRKIKKKLASKPELAPYRKSLLRNPENERSDDNYGALDFSTHGGCAMMVEGWCLLHRDFGETMLPTVCATFPRLIYARAGGTEVHGRLSCPEAARLCLLSDTPPVLVEGGREALPALYETNDWLTTRGGWYKHYLEDVADAHRRLLHLPDYTVAERSYFIAYLNQKLSAFFEAGITDDPGPRLTRTLARMEDTVFLDRIRTHLTEPGNDTAVRNLILALAAARLQGPQYTRYNHLLQECLRGYGTPGTPLGDEGTIKDADMAEVWAAYGAQVAQTLALYGARIARYYHAYAVNFWYQALFVGDMDLDRPSCKWLLYYAFTRFAFFSHPRVRAAVAAGMTEAQAAPSLDVAIVESVQIFMKTIDANAKMLDTFLAPMKALGLTNLTQRTALLQR